MPSGRPEIKRWMAWTVSSSSTSSTMKARVAPAAPGVAVGRLPLALVGEGRLVAVVAVGHDDRLLADGGRDGRADRGVVDAPHGVPHAVLVDDVRERRLVDREEVGEALGQREAPDGRRVGPARSEQVEAVALRLLGGVLVGEDVGAGRAERQGADHAGGATLHAGVVGGDHPIEREARVARRPPACRRQATPRAGHARPRSAASPSASSGRSMRTELCGSRAASSARWAASMTSYGGAMTCARSARARSYRMPEKGSNRATVRV